MAHRAWADTARCRHLSRSLLERTSIVWSAAGWLAGNRSPLPHPQRQSYTLPGYDLIKAMLQPSITHLAWSRQCYNHLLLTWPDQGNVTTIYYSLGLIKAMLQPSITHLAWSRQCYNHLLLTWPDQGNVTTIIFTHLAWSRVFSVKDMLQLLNAAAIHFCKVNMIRWLCTTIYYSLGLIKAMLQPSITHLAWSRQCYNHLLLTWPDQGNVTTIYYSLGLIKAMLQPSITHLAWSRQCYNHLLLTWPDQGNVTTIYYSLGLIKAMLQPSITHLAWSRQCYNHLLLTWPFLSVFLFLSLNAIDYFIVTSRKPIVIL